VGADYILEKLPDVSGPGLVEAGRYNFALPKPLPMGSLLVLYTSEKEFYLSHVLFLMLLVPSLGVKLNAPCGGHVVCVTRSSSHLVFSLMEFF